MHFSAPECDEHGVGLLPDGGDPSLVWKASAWALVASDGHCWLSTSVGLYYLIVGPTRHEWRGVKSLTRGDRST